MICFVRGTLPSDAFQDTGAVAILFVVGGDAFGQRVSVDSEHHGGLREVLFVLGERLLYVELLKLPDSLIQEDMSLQHLVY